jgi:ketosteroid isomerase-like protein
MSALQPAAVAREFVEAFGRRDMAAVQSLLATDVTFQSPRVRLTGAPAVGAAMGEFAQMVTGVTVLAAMQDGDRACIVYDMDTGPFGTLRAVDLVTVVAGRITEDLLVFDTAPLG